MKQLTTLIGLSLFLAACGSRQTTRTATAEPDKGFAAVVTYDEATDAPVAEAPKACNPHVAIFFPLDVAHLDDPDRKSLDEAAQCLRGGFSTVRIEGHADPRGTEAYNLALAERRAIAVKQYLAALGVAEDRMVSVSYGEAYAKGDDPQSWNYDRRAELRPVEQATAGR